MERAIGIDFGTTNTRIAYCDGTQVRVLTERDGISPFIPSAVSYQNGRASAFGRVAREAEQDFSITSLKWELTEDRLFDVGDGVRGKTAIEVVSDFVTYLKGILQHNLVNPEEHRLAVTIPVGYPLAARRRLVRAFKEGGLPVTGIYPEPVAALYAVFASKRREGYGAIFDWGGGTLDIATLRMHRNKIFVLSTEGMKEGGDDFDEWIATDALDSFLEKNSALLKDRERIWARKKRGLLLRAERAKWDYIGYPTFSWIRFVGNRDLHHELDGERFEDRLSGSVDRAVSIFRRAIARGGGVESLMKPIVLSGGTRNLDFLRSRLEAEFGDRIVDGLPQADYFQDLATDRIDSATAIGAALLMATHSRPVFSKALGIRLADSRSGRSDAFLPVFDKGETVQYGTSKKYDLYVTNPSGGTANLMVCDQLDEESEPSGSLLRIFSFPIDRKESRISVDFSITNDLLLRMKVTGAIARVAPDESEFFLPIHSFGFDLPPSIGGEL